MSDLGAIFHVKKDGVQYDAHAYTTLDECPEPNLKIKYNGQQGYVKLGNKGEGDVPCYVKVTSGTVYQVKKQAIPTGSMTVTSTGDYSVPNGINRIKVTTSNGTWYFDVSNTFKVTSSKGRVGRTWKINITKIYYGKKDGSDFRATVYWSPDINNK